MMRHTKDVFLSMMPRSFAFNTLMVLLFVVLLVLLSACQGNTLSPLTTSLSSGTVQVAQASSENTGYQVKVYFSKFPDSTANFASVFPVNRTSPTLQVATFSIQLLIAGPTPDERSNGYFSELNSLLTGPSTCSAPYPTGGPDFKLVLNKKGPHVEQGTATIQFCRATASPGVGADARVKAEINTTLKQFSNIKKVVILDKDGHCFGDESGKDFCLK